MYEAGICAILTKNSIELEISVQVCTEFHKNEPITDWYDLIVAWSAWFLEGRREFATPKCMRIDKILKLLSENVQLFFSDKLSVAMKSFQSQYLLPCLNSKIFLPDLSF